jgi:DNA primase
MQGLLLKKGGDRSHFRPLQESADLPIQNLSGECVGFGGRMVGEGEPKYLNFRNSLFRKGEVLYGPTVLPCHPKTDRAILVRGYMDFLSLHQTGVGLAATLGTGFTRPRAAPGRFTRRAVVNFDPDSAGQAATRRSLTSFLSRASSRASTSGGMDPDKFVRGGPQAVPRLLESAPTT